MIELGRPRLLDLFCGAGGAGEGYNRSGFNVTGVDIKAQRNYPHKFIKGERHKKARAYARRFGISEALAYDRIR